MVYAEARERNTSTFNGHVTIGYSGRNGLEKDHLRYRSGAIKLKIGSYEIAYKWSEGPINTTPT
jgi:hypothetical protein